MRLRTTALIAGLFGVIALAVGLVAQAQRPETRVTVGGTADTAAVVVPADMLAFAGEDGRYAVSGTGTLRAFSALPGDMEAWAADKEITYVTAMPTWESLTTTVETPEPDPSASPSEEAEASPSPSASADAGPQYESLLSTSADLWRQEWVGTDRLSVGGSEVEAGLELVLLSEDGSPLTDVDLTLTREVNDAWVAPLIVWGAILTGVGLIALVLLIIDVRPVQARAEEWMAHRQRIGSGDAGPKPGSRRARRLEGAVVPEAELTAEPDAVAPIDEPDSRVAPAQWAQSAQPAQETQSAPSAQSARTAESPDESVPSQTTSARTPFALGGASGRTASAPSSPSPWLPTTPASAGTPTSPASPHGGTPAGTPPSAPSPQHRDFLPPAQAESEDDR